MHGSYYRDDYQSLEAKLNQAYSAIRGMYEQAKKDLGNAESEEEAKKALDYKQRVKLMAIAAGVRV